MNRKLKQSLLRVPGSRFTYHLLYGAIRLQYGAIRRWQIRQQFLQFRKLASEPRLKLDPADNKFCLFDNTETTGFDRHYIYHPAWAARILEQTKPAIHVDIASTLTFCSIVSAFLPVHFYDYRPAQLTLSNLSSRHTDLTNLEFADNSIESLSCMHVVEHIGLGRYGEPLNYDGDLQAISELKRVVAPGGMLLFVVPIGQPRIQFNAHRIYSYRQIIDAFLGFQLKQFALIPDDPGVGNLIIDADEALADKQRYGCGCFWFSKQSGGDGSVSPSIPSRIDPDLH